MVEIINRLRKTTDRLTQKLGRFPNDRELSRALKISIEKIRVIKAITYNPSSLNESIGKNGTGQLINLVEDEESSSPLKEVSALIEHERIMNLLDKLTEREAEIVKLRFGLDGYDMHTLEETGRKFRITRERVRQIEAQIIKKLKQFMMQEETGKGTLRRKGERHGKRRTKGKN
jgi:RNA polymerase primary sigma factor